MKSMNQKAQMFSLDAVLSLILVMLALGLIFAIQDTSAYNLKEQQVFAELQSVGRGVSTFLVASPDLTCELKDAQGRTLYSLTHCLDSGKQITAQALGLPAGFDFKIEGLTNPIGSNVPSTADFVYSETRTMVVHAGSITKAQLEACKTGQAGCALGQPKAVVLKVWRV